MKEAPEFDLLSVGGGYAGLTAADRAAQLGLKAVLLERGTHEFYACNSRVAGGVFHVSYENPKASKHELLKAIEQVTAGHARPDLAHAIVDNVGRAIDWLREEGAQFMRVGNQAWQQWILTPLRPPVTAMEWRGHGSDVTLRTLEKNLMRRGGALHRGTAAVSLLMENGRCRGVVATRDGTTYTYRARAVVLADGGFQGNSELVREHISPAPGKLKQRGAGTSYGDCMRMAREAGAAITPLEPFYGHVLSRDAMVSDSLWPYPQLDELACAGILIDEHAQRIADEGLGGVFLANAIARRDDPLAMVAVFDEAIWQSAGRAAPIPPNPVLTGAGGTLYRSDTIEGLASAIGISPGALEKTISHYNGALAAGRLSTLAPPRSERRRKAHPIAVAPFYGTRVCSGLTYTMGGVAVDGQARVLDTDGWPIGGLYAAGAVTGGLEGGPGAGYVGGLVKAVVQGLIASERAAADAVENPKGAA